MSKNLKFRNEEFVPGASFLMTSFSRDREELEAVFSEFTTDYQQDFANQIEVADKMQSNAVMTQEQEDITKSLYAKADAVNKELNILSFWLEKAQLPTDLVSKAKKHLKDRNVEGACKVLEDIAQQVKQHESKLIPFGMKPGHDATLEAHNAELRTLNTKQTELMNKTEDVTSVNVAEYEKLHAFMKNICRAGKILFDGTPREDEYILQKLLRRMRAGNSGTK